MRFAGKVRQGELAVEMLLHDVDAALDNIVRAFFHVIEHGEAEGAQEAVKAEVGVEEVFDIIHEVEVVMDVVELGNTAYERRHGAGSAFFAGGEVGKYLVGQQAVELLVEAVFLACSA